MNTTLTEIGAENSENRTRKLCFLLFLAAAAGLLFLLVPQMRSFLIVVGSRLRGRAINHAVWQSIIVSCAISGFAGCAIAAVLLCFRRLNTALACVFAAIVFASVVVRIVMYVRGRSLWLDEAMLAESLITRNFRELFASPLANGQTAPVLYLLTVKSITALFGYGEAALRIYSLFAFLGVLALEWYLMRRSFKTGAVFALFALAATATLPIFMFYSHEFKPYMGDAFFALAVLSLCHAHTAGRLKLPVIAAFYAIIPLFSTPSVFFIGAALAAEFIEAIVKKNPRRVLHIAAAGIAVLALFVPYYVFWLMPVADDPVMADYWNNNSFHILAFKPADIKNNFRMVYGMLGPRCVFYALFAAAGIFLSAKKGNRISRVLVPAVILLLAASNMGKYPVANRLWLFVFPLLGIYMGVCFFEISQHGGGGG